LEYWISLNQLNPEPQEDSLYAKVKANRAKFERLYRSVMVAEAETEVKHRFLREEVAQWEEATARRAMVDLYGALEIDLEEFFGEPLTPENVFELFEKLSSEYLRP
jgi:hypothetical protein